MNKPLYCIAVISLAMILFGSSCTALQDAQLAPQNQDIIDGQILFSPINSGITYLIDRSGNVDHTWPSNYLPGESVMWLGDGTILRAIKVDIAGYGGSGGGVQKIQWDGTLTWDYRYNTNENLSHHDITLLPNGNVLLIAWELKTAEEAIEAGRDPNTIPDSGKFLAGKLIEVKPTGPTTGDIVWEWHTWDHLVQDFDPSKENYGVVGDHPELIDINYGDTFIGMSDWLHTNSIDYNPDLDQILLSVHNFNEIWVIDHSTTTEQAAGHTGGNSGKGGDLLYRWGNPQAYRAGIVKDQRLFGQHDATWIKPGLPGAGDILVFNNGFNRPSGPYSTVVEITPPVDAEGYYYLSEGGSYGPGNFTWRYIADPPTDFYSAEFSGAQRLSDGDTLICDGGDGHFFEVNPNGTTVWEYYNPYPSPLLNQVFKIEFIPTASPPEPQVPNLYCSGSLSWTDISPGGTVVGSFQVQNIGDQGSLLNWTINTSSITWGTWTYSPESGGGLTPEQGPVTVQVTVTAPDEENADFEGYVRVENLQNPDDFEVIPVILKTPVDEQYSQQFLLQGLIRLLQHHPAIALLLSLRTFFKDNEFFVK